jgi:hypothetical protein
MTALSFLPAALVLLDAAAGLVLLILFLREG